MYLQLLLALSLGLGAWGAGCPFAQQNAHIGGVRKLQNLQAEPAPSIPNGGFAAVKEDIKAMLTDSQDFWPADFGNYGPFMIRLAWHCAGSYRTSDGRGGCDGGRIRHFPEQSWDDNTNLDKALRLLEPIKLKYGDSLTWADLIALVGDTSIEFMGGPTLGFCGGRMDDPDGSASLTLGPTPEQEALAPCEVNGNCTFPLGPTTVRLIYVNPGGPLGVSDPVGSAHDIRSSFGRMGMNDRETVALIGGGHAFGKVHGACPTGPGPSPLEDPTNPWPGTCGRPGSPLYGRGPNTFTSGYEGTWTSRPTEWSNDYFVRLLNETWVRVESPGGLTQWRRKGKSKAINMLTSDMALINDPSYLKLVREFARDIKALEVAFADAWYKLTARDMGPAERCIGELVPPPQPFQVPLPPAPTPPDFEMVKAAIKTSLFSRTSFLMPDMTPEGKAYYGALYVTLAYQCASTFRATDFAGGCNGATIRFRPEKHWPENAGMGGVLNVLRSIRKLFLSRKPTAPRLTWSDLIVLAGQVALEEAGAPRMKFCPGRSDAMNTRGLRDAISNLRRRTYAPDVILSVRDNQEVRGLTNVQLVALAGRLRSPSQQARLGFSGSYTDDPSALSNDFYKLLLSENWEPVNGPIAYKDVQEDTEYKAEGKNIFVTAADLALVWDSEYKQIVQYFAADEAAFLEAFANAWPAFMNADRFDGPASSPCD